MTQLTPRVIAYSYLRLSTKIQLKGDGKRRQLEDTIAAAERNGWTLSDQTFHDLGVSAFKGDNMITGALSQFLRLVEGGHVAKGSVLMVENPDRISREGVTKSVTILMTLLSADIMVYTTSDDRLYAGDKRDAFLDLITWGIAAERGHDESARKSERILKAKEAQRVKARATGYVYSKLCPHWIEVVGTGDNRKHKLIPEKVEMIQLLYKLRLEGWGLYDITKHLNESKYKPFQHRNSSMTSDMWHVATLKRWLIARTVIGEFQPVSNVTGKRVNAGEAIKDYFPAIISEQDFRRVRGTFKEGKQGRVPDKVGANVFRGLLQCQCGCGIHVSVKRSASRRKGIESQLMYRKLECPRGKVKLCAFKQVHYHLIEGLVIASLRKIEWGGLLKTKSDSDESTMESLRKSVVAKEDSLIDIDKQMGNLITSIAAMGMNVHLQKMLDELTIEHAQLSEGLQAAKQNHEDLQAAHKADEGNALSISQTLNLVLHQAADGDSRLHLCHVLNQHLSKVVITPLSNKIIVYGKQGDILAEITPLDKELHHARVVTPSLEWDIEQHFQTNRIEEDT